MVRLFQQIIHVFGKDDVGLKTDKNKHMIGNIYLKKKPFIEPSEINIM